jgi:isopenicillin-N N-acyltransferase-like protein
MSGLPLPVIAVQGSPADCGAAYGAAATELIAGNVSAYEERFARCAGLSRGAVRRAGARFRETTLRAYPHLAAMLDAVADAARVHVEDLYAVNARTELLYGVPDECTSLGVIGEHTVVGQNWDWHPEHRPYAVVLVTTDEKGFAVATLTEAGMLAKTGVNSTGLGVCINMLGCDRDGRPGGVPYHVLVRAVLEADELGNAVRAACQTPRSASINLLIGQPYDGTGGGEVIDLELVPGDVGVLHPVTGRIAHANHIETPLQVRDTLKDLGGSSYFRAARARRLLDRGLPFEEILADHFGFPHAICRHVDDRDAPCDRSQTLYSVLLDLDERRIGVAAGPPCGAEYTWEKLI